MVAARLAEATSFESALKKLADGATPFDWPTDLDAIAETIDWNGGDLFPHFGMTSLGA